MDIVGQLKQAVQEKTEAGVSLYRVAKDAGISYPVLHRFMHGERDIYLETAAKLAASLGVELTTTGRPAEAPGTKAPAKAKAKGSKRTTGGRD